MNVYDLGYTDGFNNTDGSDHGIMEMVVGFNIRLIVYSGINRDEMM